MIIWVPLIPLTRPKIYTPLLQPLWHTSYPPHLRCNFGNITNTSIAFGYNDQGEMLQYQSRDDRRSDLGGFSFNFGVILDQKISESLDLTASFTYTPQSEISSKNKNQFSTIAIDANQVEFVQSTYEIDLQAINLDNTNLVLPSKISFNVLFKEFFFKFNFSSSFTSVCI